MPRLKGQHILYPDFNSNISIHYNAKTIWNKKLDIMGYVNWMNLYCNTNIIWLIISLTHIVSFCALIWVSNWTAKLLGYLRSLLFLNLMKKSLVVWVYLPCWDMQWEFQRDQNGELGCQQVLPRNSEHAFNPLKDSKVII